jgi:hypothetical protein
MMSEEKKMNDSIEEPNVGLNEEENFFSPLGR